MNSSHKLLAAVNNQTNLLLLLLVGTASPDLHTTASPGGAVFSIHNPGDVSVTNALPSGQENNCAA